MIFSEPIIKLKKNNLSKMFLFAWMVFCLFFSGCIKVDRNKVIQKVRQDLPIGSPFEKIETYLSNKKHMNRFRYHPDKDMFESFIYPLDYGYSLYAPSAIFEFKLDRNKNLKNIIYRIKPFPGWR